MNPWLIRILALIGFGIYAGVYWLFRQLGCDAIQALLLLAAFIVAVVGLAFRLMDRAEEKFYD